LNDRSDSCTWYHSRMCRPFSSRHWAWNFYLTPKVPWVCFSKNTKKLPPWRLNYGHAKKYVSLELQPQDMTWYLYGSMWNFFLNFWPHRFWDFSMWRKKTMLFYYFIPCPRGRLAFVSHLRHDLELHEVEFPEIYNVRHARYLRKKS
jgi:hypothetical protein